MQQAVAVASVVVVLLLWTLNCYLQQAVANCFLQQTVAVASVALVLLRWTLSCYLQQAVADTSVALVLHGRHAL